MQDASKSSYECEREKRIAANNAILKSLGLDDKPALVDKRPKAVPAQKKRRYEDDPEYVAEAKNAVVSLWGSACCEIPREICGGVE